MSLCDRCQRPGVCCSNMLLNNGLPHDKADTFAEAEAWLRSIPQPHVNGVTATLAFKPFYKDSRGHWHWWCTKLVNGRCSIYETRPSLCESYPAGYDWLCWHHDPTTAEAPVKVPADKGTHLDLHYDSVARFRAVALNKGHSDDVETNELPDRS